MKVLITTSLLILTSCGATIKDAANGIADPTERGCMYIATAIIVGAIIRGVMNR